MIHFDNEKSYGYRDSGNVEPSTGQTEEVVTSSLRPPRQPAP